MNKKEDKVSLASYGKKYIPMLIIAVIFSIISSYVSVIGPDRIREMTELIGQGIMAEMDLDKISSIAFGLAILYLIGALVNYGSSFIMSTISQRLTQSLRRAIAGKVNRMPLNYFDSHSQGDTLSRVTNDLDTLGQSLNQSLATLISASTLLVGSLIMMFRTSVILTWVSIGTVLIGFLGTLSLIHI